MQVWGKARGSRILDNPEICTHVPFGVYFLNFFLFFCYKDKE